VTDYRYIFGSLRTEQIIAEIPLFGTYMDLELNVGGRLDGSFQLDMTGIDDQILLDATIPGRCFVVCERNGIPIWGGFVWSRTYQSQSKSVQLFAQSFEVFPTHQLMRSQFDRTNIEQLQIFKDLWNDMQAVSGRNMGVNIPSAVPPTVVTKTVSVAPTDFHYYNEIMAGLTNADDGFDWTIDISKIGDRYVKTLRYGYPELGSVDPSLLTFEYPGNVLNFYATESMSTSGTNVFSLGAGEGTSMIYTEVINQDLIDSGWPRWDITAAYKHIDKQAIINSFGKQEAEIRRPPMLLLKPTLKANLLPEFGSFGLGDACNLVVKDPRFPTGLTFSSRIIKWTLQPQSSTNSDEFSLVFDGDEEKEKRRKVPKDG
jgi:hypothetical protein